jgi:hypothetical protein
MREDSEMKKYKVEFDVVGILTYVVEAPNIRKAIEKAEKHKDDWEYVKWSADYNYSIIESSPYAAPVEQQG